MDVVLKSADFYFLTPYVYPETWKEDDPYRQFLSMFVLLTSSAYILYFTTATLSYIFLFDKALMKHPLFLKDQVKREILTSVKSFPTLSILNVILFFVEVRGYSQLYDDAQTSRFGYFSIPLGLIGILVFSEIGSWLVHRFLHYRWVYRNIHKVHHKWVIPTPYSSHAFHPLDTFLQGCPYHLYAFLFPLHSYVFLVVFVFENFWSLGIHDGNYQVPESLKNIINGAAHHTDHHIYVSCNYGQHFTFADRLLGTYRKPSSFINKGPHDEVRNLMNGVSLKSKKA